MNSTPQENADELVEMFEMFDDWEDRYIILIDMGRRLPPMSDANKTEETRVHGCQSQVWLIAQPQESGGIEFTADSDSIIVKGLIGILQKVYSGQSPQRILSFDVEGLFERLGLNQHLSLNRRNGLHGMVQRIKTLAALLARQDMAPQSR